MSPDFVDYDELERQAMDISETQEEYDYVRVNDNDIFEDLHEIDLTADEWVGPPAADARGTF